MASTQTEAKYRAMFLRGAVTAANIVLLVAGRWRYGGHRMAEALDRKSDWVTRVLGFSFSAGPGAAESPPMETDPSDTAAPNGMAVWKAARAKAISALQALESAIRDMKDPESDAAIILLRAIRANLTVEPATSRQVDELERYIMTDDIIEEAQDPNGFGFEVELRAPLLAALEGLRRDQAAAAKHAA